MEQIALSEIRQLSLPISSLEKALRYPVPTADGLLLSFLFYEKTKIKQLRKNITINFHSFILKADGTSSQFLGPFR